jgi:hypothetical protein
MSELNIRHTRGQLLMAPLDPHSGLARFSIFCAFGYLPASFMIKYGQLCVHREALSSSFFPTFLSCILGENKLLLRALLGGETPWRGQYLMLPPGLWEGTRYATYSTFFSSLCDRKAWLNLCYIAHTSHVQDLTLFHQSTLLDRRSIRSIFVRFVCVRVRCLWCT